MSTSEIPPAPASVPTPLILVPEETKKPLKKRHHLGLLKRATLYELGVKDPYDLDDLDEEE